MRFIECISNLSRIRPLLNSRPRIQMAGQIDLDRHRKALSVVFATDIRSQENADAKLMFGHVVLDFAVELHHSSLLSTLGQSSLRAKRGSGFSLAGR
jgi:hypothetical protein